MVKYLPEFEYFTVFLKNRKFISKIRRSKVTDYAALTGPMYKYWRWLHIFLSVFPDTILVCMAHISL